MTQQIDQWHDERVFFYRFGFGPIGQWMPNLKGGARLYLANLIRNPEIALIKSEGLPTHQEACAAIISSEDARRINNIEVLTRIEKNILERTGIHERLVHFWSNFFGVSSETSMVARATVGEWERNTIRPNILGSFYDLLLGTIQHPAFISCLENQRSVSPVSPYGKRSGKSYNENMGREILELYTLGDATIYAQIDVEQISLAFCGWSFTSIAQASSGAWGGHPDRIGQFIFQHRWSHPHKINILGQSFSGNGIKRCEDILRFLTHHEATSRHIAIRLCRHFISDDPPEKLINKIASTFYETQGDLLQTTLCLVEANEAWDLPLQKIRTPYETFIAACRAINTGWQHEEMRPIFSALNSLKNYPWRSESPSGYSDKNACWLTPNTIRVKAECLQVVMSRLYDGNHISHQPTRFARRSFRIDGTHATVRQVRRLQRRSRRWGMVGIFLSPEFNLR